MRGDHLKRDCPQLSGKGKGKGKYEQKGKEPAKGKPYKGDGKGKQKGKQPSGKTGGTIRAAAAAALFKGASAMQAADIEGYCKETDTAMQENNGTAFMYVFLCCVLLSFVIGVVIGAVTALYLKKRLGGGSAAAHGDANGRVGPARLVSQDTQTSLSALKALYTPKFNVDI